MFFKLIWQVKTLIFEIFLKTVEFVFYLVRFFNLF